MSTSAVGFVAPAYMTTSSAAMERAGSNETNSCVITWRFGSEGTPRAPNKPASALPLRELNVWDSGGSGTCRSAADRGGARCGFHFARMMT